MCRATTRLVTWCARSLRGDRDRDPQRRRGPAVEVRRCLSNTVGDHAADVATILGARVVIPLHFEGWAHLTEGAVEIGAAFAGNGLLDRLVMLDRGQQAEV